MRTGLDYLSLGPFLLAKDAQPPWREDSDWTKTFPLD
jgi:carbamoyltransferase